MLKSLHLRDVGPALSDLESGKRTAFMCVMTGFLKPIMKCDGQFSLSFFNDQKWKKRAKDTGGVDSSSVPMVSRLASPPVLSSLLRVPDVYLPANDSFHEEYHRSVSVRDPYRERHRGIVKLSTRATLQFVEGNRSFAVEESSNVSCVSSRTRFCFHGDIVSPERNH